MWSYGEQKNINMYCLFALIYHWKKSLIVIFFFLIILLQ